MNLYIIFCFDKLPVIGDITCAMEDNCVPTYQLALVYPLIY